jgi:hypothetical protein
MAEGNRAADTVVVGIRLSRDIHQRAKELARAEGRTQSGLLAWLITRQLREQQ